MSKAKTLIVVIGGIIIVLVVITIGTLKFFFYPSPGDDIGKQIVDFLTYAIISSLGVGVVMGEILNFNEKKELKIQTKLSNKYQETIIGNEKKNLEALSRIEESIAINEGLQEGRDKEQEKRNNELDKIVKHFSQREVWEEIHENEHKKISEQFTTLNKRVSKNEDYIQNLRVKNKNVS